MISQRFRTLNHTSRAILSSIFVLFRIRKSLLFRGCALGTWRDVCLCGSCKRRDRRVVVRKDAFITLVADTLFVERANTIVMIFAGFAFIAFPFEVVLAEQLWICNCSAGGARGAPPGFAAP